MASHDAEVARKADTIMAQADKDGDGVITFDEFVIVSKKFPNILVSFIFCRFLIIVCSYYHFDNAFAHSDFVCFSSFLVPGLSNEIKHLSPPPVSCTWYVLFLPGRYRSPINCTI